MITYLPEDFYDRVWKILCHCPTLIFKDKQCLEKLEKSRWDKEGVQGSLSSDERRFAEKEVESHLNKLQDPSYRQLNIEALLVLSEVLEANPQLQLEKIELEKLLHYAARLLWEETHPQQAEASRKKSERGEDREHEAWNNFYNSPPHHVANAIMAALAFRVEEKSGQDSHLTDFPTPPLRK